MNSKERVYASGRLPIHFSNVRFTCEFLLCFSLTWEFQVWKYFTVDLTKSRLKNKICIQFKPDSQLSHMWKHETFLYGSNVCLCRERLIITYFLNNPPPIKNAKWGLISYINYCLKTVSVATNILVQEAYTIPPLPSLPFVLSLGCTPLMNFSSSVPTSQSKSTP